MGVKKNWSPQRFVQTLPNDLEFLCEDLNSKVRCLQMLPLHLHLNFQKILRCQSTPRRPLFEEGGEQGERALEPEDRARAPLYSQTSAALPSRCAALVKSHSLADFSLLLCGTGWWFAVRLQECCPKRFCAAPGAQSVWGGCGCFCPCGHQTLSPWCLRKWVFQRLSQASQIRPCKLTWADWSWEI